jgi:aerobic C4-dicarboxylate transport protein
MTGSHRPWYSVLYVQVLIAIALGILIGHYFPQTGVALKPLGDGFISLIKMMIAPVIFCTAVHGIGSMSDLKKIGRVGVKTLIYFEAVSTLALAIGLLVGHVLQPGKGFDIDPASLDPNAVASYVKRAKEEGLVAHLLAIIPETFIGAFAKGDLLQVLLVSLLTGFAVTRLGELGEKINGVINAMAKIFFGVIRIIVRAAPIGALGAMAFTVGAYGLGSLVNLVELIALAILFLAQATNTPLTFGQVLGILVIAMITSKGRFRRDRGWLRDACRDARDRARYPDPVARHSARH